MARSESSNAAKVGLLVVAALGGLAWLSVQSGLFGTALSTESMRKFASTFSDVEGITVGTPVKIAGVTIGEITNIELKPNGTAVVSYKVKESTPLPADVTAQIATSGLIGERFLALVPTSATPPGTQPTLLPPPSDSNPLAIPSAGGAGAGDMASNFSKVGEDLQAMTATLRQVLGNPENAQKLQGIIDGLSNFAGQAGEGSGGAFEKFGAVADRLDRLTAGMERGEGPLGTLLKNDNGQTKQTLADLNGAMGDLREVLGKINKGEGTVGKLINDPQTADKIDSALDTLASVGERVEQFRTEVDFNAYSLTNESGIGKGEFKVTLQPRPTRFYVLGYTADGFASAAKDVDDQVTASYFGKDFGNTGKLTVQFGHVFQNTVLNGQDVSVRIGIKDNTGGVGLDTAIPTDTYFGDIVLSTDLYDFSGTNTPNSNTPHWDVKAKLNLWNNNLYAITGYDNILNQEYGSPIVGLGLKFQDDDLKYFMGKAL